MRIVLAPSAYLPHVGGIEEITRQLALKLAERGHRTSVLTNRWPEGVLPEERLDGVDVVRLDFPLPVLNLRGTARFVATAGAAAVRLLTTLRWSRPDVVHVIGAGPQSAYLAALRPLIPGRVVFTAQGELTFDAHGIFTRSASLRLGLRTMLKRADAVTACSSYVLRELAAVREIRGPVTVIPNGVDPAEFEPSEHRPTTEPSVLGVGRLVPQKGFDVLLEAAADPRLSHVRVVVAGEGPERVALERQAQELGISDRVSFVGAASRARLAALFRDCSVFAFPSRGEPFGIALLEAMAAGVPPVATAAGGVPEFAADGENALLVQPDDAAALAEAISRVVNDEGLAERLAANGRRTAEALAWDGIVECYERVYAG